MIGKALEVSGMIISVSVDGGEDVRLTSLAPVTVTVTVDEDGNAEQVFADEGMELSCRDMCLYFRPGANITHLLDRRELSKKLREAE